MTMDRNPAGLRLPSEARPVASVGPDRLPVDVALLQKRDGRRHQEPNGQGLLPRLPRPATEPLLRET